MEVKRKQDRVNIAETNWIRPDSPPETSLWANSLYMWVSSFLPHKRPAQTEPAFILFHLLHFDNSTFNKDGRSIRFIKGYFLNVKSGPYVLQDFIVKEVKLTRWWNFYSHNYFLEIFLITILKCKHIDTIFTVQWILRNNNNPLIWHIARLINDDFMQFDFNFRS